MCFTYDAGYPTFFRSSVVTARKSHKCTECYKVIAPKDKYEYIVGCWDNNFDTHKICQKCQDLRKKIHDIEISHGCKEYEAWPPYGALKESLEYYEDLNGQT